VDADVTVEKPVPRSVVFPRSGVTYLGRTVFPHSFPHTESGLIGFDLEPVAARRLADTMERILVSGEVYELAQWHDCSIFDAARLRLAGEIAFHSISRDETRDHVFDEALGTWLRHHRGRERKARVSASG
jgi:hypothetical protein